ncbi:DMT family transporter [Humitalea sp. 24SJ18S-53]|uniref:DMT family transporter n=1 Tax=Humitalea sp. 24SJ18S-53 TaxID=3422307 RepID=UPI003D67B997
MGRERRIGLLCAFAVLLVWTGFLLTGRLSAAQAFTPWDMTALRHGGSFLGVLPLIAVFGWPRLPWRQTAVIVATAGFGFPILAYIGFGFAPASHGGVMLPGMLPFLSAALGAAFMHEAWTQTRIASLVVVAAGIGLLAVDTFGANPGAWRGDLLFLGGSLSWAIYTLLVRRWQVPALTATMAVAVYAAPVFLPIWWLFLPSNLAAVPLGAIAFQTLYQGILAVLLAGFLFTRAVNALGPTTTTSITALVPAMTALAAWPLLGEPLGVAGLAGVALVSAGMMLAVLPPPMLLGLFRR